ncbi:hypothetical protein BH09ACT2_BH09ACT2_09200 [soil metagenome]
MSLNSILRALGRRWYVLAVFVLLTLVGASAAVKANPVYWARVDIVLLAPPSGDNPNSLRTTTESLVDFAGIIEREINGNHVAPRFSASSATLYGAGVRDGYKVALQNDGGQWSNSFRQPVLDVEAVASSPEGVKSKLIDVVSRIDSLVESRQAAAAVPPTELITTLSSPSPASIVRIGGSRLRAVGAVGLLGAVSGIALTLFLDRTLVSRKARRSAATAI